MRAEGIDGLFDIEVFKNDVSLLLIETKMWSTLTNNQLKNQAEHLIDRDCNGLHILLGISDLLVSDFDFQKKTNRLSKKVGYLELTGLLSDYQKMSIASASKELAHKYELLLQQQVSDLNNLKNNHKFYYCTLFDKFRQDLDFETSIIAMNNRGETKFFLRDFPEEEIINFKGKSIGLFQEFEKNTLYIKADCNEDKSFKHNFKCFFVDKLQTGIPINWETKSKSSKYHKLAYFTFDLNEPQEWEKAKQLFKKSHEFISNFCKTS